jgi:hypothetical protein
MALIIAECVCHGLRIGIVRGDVMDLNCDGIICGPPRGANPLAVLFPELMSPRRNVLDRVVPLPGERCPSDWLKESEVPLMIAPPCVELGLRGIALVNTDPRGSARYQRDHRRDSMMAKAVRLAIGRLYLECGCRRLGLVAPQRWRGIASAIMVGVRQFAEDHPDSRAELLLCDHNDPRAFAKRIHHLFETHVAQWGWSDHMGRRSHAWELR